LLALLVGFAAGAQEQLASNMDVLRQSIAADKRVIIADNLALTESQAAAFWPIYDAYQQDLAALNRRLVALIDNYASAYNAGNVQAAKADELVKEFLAIEGAQLDLQKKYAKKLNGVIPAVERARYLQMEHKIRALIDYDLAANIPLVD
jgi:hypothetical protein